jgi:hypothetical protein
MTTELELTGLDGANPLAFLAAVGTLRTLTQAWPGRTVKMAWRLVGKWMPFLQVGGDAVAQDEALTVLHEQLNDKHSEPQFTLQPPAPEPESSLKKLSQGRYREFSKLAVQRPETPEWFDFAATWGCEFTPPRAKENLATPTNFDFTAGNQKFLEMVRDTIQETTRDHLHQCLFETWRYLDEELSLRWDLLDETRRYALLAIDPASPKNPIKTMRGANRLAVEALPLFPVIPASSGVQTTGFAQIDQQATWTWPLWSPSLDVNVIRSVLAQAELYVPQPDRNKLKAQGVEEVYRSRVVMPAGYYRCFAPPQPA